MNFQELVGEHVLQGVEYGTVTIDVYGSKENVTAVKFMLDGVTYSCHEDPQDGYRSSCEDLIVSDIPLQMRFEDIRVVCSMKDNDRYSVNDVLVIRDVLNGKTILEIGTMDTDDYYPWFHYEYTPENMSVNDK